MSLQDSIIAVLSVGPADFWSIMAQVPGRSAVDVADALRSLRSDKAVHKMNRIWRNGSRPKPSRHTQRIF